MSCFVLPNPKSVIEKSGFCETVCEITSNNQNWLPHLSAFCALFGKLYKKSALIGENGIVVTRDDALNGGEYVIDIENGISVYAADTDGVCCALATLLQLLRPSFKGWGTEKTYIKDLPDKNYRGLMVDLARQLHTKEQILKYMDICFLAKINYLHFYYILNEYL